MTNTLSWQEWLRVIREEYLDAFIVGGGASLKFAVPSDDDLSPLLKGRFASDARELDYLVVVVDSGDTRVHMLHEIFFRIAEQIDWRLLARRVVLKLCEALNYRTEGIDPTSGTPILEAVSAINTSEDSVVESALRELNLVNVPNQDTSQVLRAGLQSQIDDQLRTLLPQAISLNQNMSRDFRVAMSHLCLAEMSGAGHNEDAEPLIEWLTGVNRRIGNVRRYSIYNGILRTNARHVLESLLYWVRFAGYSGMGIILDGSRVTLRRNPRDGLRFYTRSAAMDHYELLRELIDGADRLDGLMMLVLSNEDSLDEEIRGKGFFIYQALWSRIADEVRSRTQANPLATLVRLSDGPISEGTDGWSNNPVQAQ